jgi:hypothetical protein
LKTAKEGKKMKKQDRFEETKIKMVMQLRGVSRPAAIDIISGKARPETDEKKSGKRVRKSAAAGILSRDGGEPDFALFAPDDSGEFMSAKDFFGN